MRDNFTLVAKIEAKEEHRETIKQALLNIIEPTLKEEGCLLYSLHQDRNNPNLFMFYEVWGTKKLWEAHNVSPHILAHKLATDGMMSEFKLFQLSKLTR